MKGIPPKHVAQIAGVDVGIVYNVRRYRIKETSRQLRDAAVRELFNRGASDDEIKAALYMDLDTVRKARGRMKLRRRVTRSDALAQADWSLSDKELAARHQCSQSSVAYWRKQQCHR
jgi:DNA-binding CsgD family transcriptional regulator